MITRIRKHLTTVGLAAALAAPAAALAAPPSPESVADTLRRVADWQLANPSGTSIHDWVIAPLYDGLIRAAFTTGDARYLAAVVELGHQANWAPGPRLYMADDHAVGHAWLDIHLIDPSHKERLAPVKERFDYVIDHPITIPLSFADRARNQGVAPEDRWSWCDALYMAPPTLARLYSATGDKKYLAFLDQEFRFTYDTLWDPEVKLFYRDDRFFDKRTPKGKKVFWSRGNGWVYAGLCLTLEHLPADHPTRGFYENLFREMTTAVLKAQQADGLWRPSLLDPEEIPHGEASGSGFYTFGLAWGLNHGLIEGRTVREAALRGWQGLAGVVGEDGHVGYVQPIGAAPDKFTPQSTADYGTGAFLLAGSEIFKLVGGEVSVDPAHLLDEAEEIAEKHLTTPRAYARIIVERAEDVAWENDKIAFRVYGPPLRESMEDAGVDVWAKRVDYPIIDKWYRLANEGVRSYHEDHGEGLDAYKVGDTLGCGGMALWDGEKLIMPNVYQKAEIRWTSRDIAWIRLFYRYPDQNGRAVWERRDIHLRMGEQLYEVTSRFTYDHWHWNARPLAGTTVAVGLVNQTAEARAEFDQATGTMALHDTLADSAFASGAAFAPAAVVDMREAPHTGQLEGRRHALAILRTDAEGMVRYRAGYAWAAAGADTSSEAWQAILKKADDTLSQP